jgi:hypothetical protein
LDPALEPRLTPVADDSSQNRERRRLLEPVRSVSGHWYEHHQAGLCLFQEEAQRRGQRTIVIVLLWMGMIQRGHQMARKRKASLPLE